MPKGKMPSNQEPTMFEKASRYEADNHHYAAAARALDTAMKQYEASLNAMYRPTIYSSDSADVGAYGNLERHSARDQ